MPTSVFISYCHKQGDWVWNRLVPCLRAGGTDIHIDHERFKAGKAVVGQMDTVQDRAKMAVLVLSPDYLGSRYCAHEMERAILQDPSFTHGLVVPIKRLDCALPPQIKRPNPLNVDLQDDSKADQWDLLLRSCGADLGAPAPHWLDALHKTCRFLKRDDSVNLVVQKKPRKPKWDELIQEVMNRVDGLGKVDLESGATTSRKALVEEILRTCGAPTAVPDDKTDLVTLNHVLSKRPVVSRLAMVHFDLVRSRPYYDVDLFATLRNLMMDSRKLVLLIESNEFFVNLLPANHPLSSMTTIKTVELNGLP